jgi:hypothetical protein
MANPPASGASLSVEQRLANAEADIRSLRTAVDEHTNWLAEIIRKDPELRQKVRVQP